MVRTLWFTQLQVALNSWLTSVFIITIIWMNIAPAFIWHVIHWQEHYDIKALYVTLLFVMLQREFCQFSMSLNLYNAIQGFSAEFYSYSDWLPAPNGLRLWKQIWDSSTAINCTVASKTTDHLNWQRSIITTLNSRPWVEKVPVHILQQPYFSL